MDTSILPAVLASLNQNRPRFLDELKAILAIPSVSTDPAYRADMQRAAEWFADRLRALGMSSVQIYATSGHPLVYGEWKQAGAAPTVLIYGHYDVQPPDPLDQWTSPPFAPQVRGENLYARGASDMKGQVLAVLEAVETLLRHGALGVNLKWLIEGEEEIGSPSLEGFLRDQRDLLQADFCLNCDSGMIAADAPAITCALRGLAYFEIRVYGPAHDLHSGLYGGVVHNPAIVLAELIAGMHDEQGRVTLPGFYEKVRPLSPQERADLARLPIDDEYYLQATGAPALYGEAGYTPVERIGARPTLDVNGLLAGFTGSGSKTVIPAWAMAKISMRLVADQDPQEVHQQLLQYLREHAPATVRWEVQDLHGAVPSLIPTDSAAVQALARALEETWGIRPCFKREGGSIPVVAQMQQVLGLPSVLTGFGLPDDNLHAPNEKIHLPTWYRGIEALARFFLHLNDNGKR